MTGRPFAIKKWQVYLADLNPRHKAEPGKTRPVVVVQTDLLNTHHPTTIICPITTNVQAESEVLRVHLKKTEAGLKQSSDILVDQIRAIDNSRFLKFLGRLSPASINKLSENIQITLD
jgi:mRNA interferase MazF